jgi:hypothetical protein
MRDIPEPTEQFSAELTTKLKKLCDEADTTVIQEIKEYQSVHQNYLNKKNVKLPLSRTLYV